MKKLLAGMAIVGLSSTVALACPMSSNMSTSVDRELVVASIATDTTEIDTAQLRLLEEETEEKSE
jgi:hypothetical protein